MLCLLQRFSLLLRPGESEAEGAGDAAAGLLMAAGTLEVLLARSDRAADAVAQNVPAVLEALRAALEEVPRDLLRDSAWLAEALEALRARLLAA